MKPKTAIEKQSLPFTLSESNGRRARKILSKLAWGVFCLFMAGAFVSSAYSGYSEEPSLIGLFFVIVFTLSMLFLAWSNLDSLVKQYVWSYTFTETEIIVRNLFREKRYQVSDLKVMSLESEIRATPKRYRPHSKREAWFLELLFKEDISLRIEGSENGYRENRMTKSIILHEASAVDADEDKLLLEGLMNLLRPIYLPHQAP